MPATARICRMMTVATIPRAAHSIQAGKYEPNRSLVGAELHAATGSAIATRPKTREPRRCRPARSHLPLPAAIDLTRPNSNAPPTDMPPPPDIITLEISLAPRQTFYFFYRLNS